MLSAVRVEYAHEKKIRSRNKVLYRLAHWPIWIWVFFLAPGPLTFNLFAGTANRLHLFWLGVVLLGTGTAAVFGQLPGVEPRPYILRFCEDKPNPLYRRVCYTLAWNALLSFALLNLAGLVLAAVTGVWRLKQLYSQWYVPLFLAVIVAGALGFLPRVRQSTKGEGTERRYFYGTVWAVTIAQSCLLFAWKLLPVRQHWADCCKLFLYSSVLAAVGILASRGILPRTRPILPGELMIAD